MLQTRSHSWREAGLLIDQIDTQAVRRAQRRGIVFLLLIGGVIAANAHKKSLLALVNVADSGFASSAFAVAIVIVLLILGWALAAELGRAVGPTLFRRMDPATAGTVGFFTRLLVLAIVLLLALSEAGINTASLTIGASFVAVIFGLAAQQTLGNVIAGIVLLSARPFRVGERVRLQAGGVGGQLEGVVSSLGLLYTSFASGEDLTMVPNSVVLNSAVIPLREPESIDLRARLRAGVTPRALQRTLEERLQTPLRDEPRITLEELDGDEVIVRITATPRRAIDGAALATEVLEIVSEQTSAAQQRKPSSARAAGTDASTGEGADGPPPAGPVSAPAGGMHGDG